MPPSAKYSNWLALFVYKPLSQWKYLAAGGVVTSSQQCALWIVHHYPLLGLGENLRSGIFGARFPLVHMGSWVHGFMGSKYKLQGGRFGEGVFSNLNLNFAPKFRKNLNFWRQIQIAVWFGVGFNLTKGEGGGEHMNNKGTLWVQVTEFNQLIYQ